MSLDLMVGRDGGQLDSRPSLIYIVTLHTLVKTFSMCVRSHPVWGLDGRKARHNEALLKLQENVLHTIKTRRN